MLLYGRRQPEDTAFTKLLRERQRGDYGFIDSISSEDAEKDYELAKELVEAITTYLKEHNFIS